MKHNRAYSSCASRINLSNIKTGCVTAALVLLGGLPAFSQTPPAASDPGLVERWAFTAQSDVSATPAIDVAGGAVYIPDSSGYIYKLNSRTGTVTWSHALAEYGLPSALGSRSTPTLSGSALLIEAGTHVLALDRDTGDLLWKRDVDAARVSAITGAPVVSNGVVYLGVSPGQEAPFGSRGSVVALSELTGQTLWQTYLVTPGQTGLPAIDAAHNQLLVTALPDSILSLDLTTGTVRWTAKAEDLEPGVTLFSTNINGVATDLAGAGQKDGTYSAFDRSTGALLWKQALNPHGKPAGSPCCAVSDGQRIYVAIRSTDGDVWGALDAGTGAVVWQVADPAHVPVDAREQVTALAPVFGANGVLYCADSTGLLLVLDADSGRKLRTLHASGDFRITPAIGNETIYWGSSRSSDDAGKLYSFGDSLLPNVTTTELTSSLNPAMAGQSVTLTATLTPSTATGKVTFFDGVTPIGSGTLTSGVTTFTTTSLSVGTHLLTATYGGDTHNLTSTSGILTETINAAPRSTNTTLVTAPNPSTTGQSVLFTASVLPITATGTVAFFDGGTQIGSGTLTLGVATLSMSTLSAGTHSLTATYGGDTGDAGSTSGAVAQTVQTITTTALTTTPNPSNAGGNVTLTATVSPASATGTITFSQGLTTLGTATLKSGSAVLVVPFATAGVYLLTATYSGDSSDLGSTSNIITQTVQAAQSATSTTLVTTPNPSTAGGNVTLTATVSPASATGTITFSQGITTLGTAALKSGSASLVAPFATAGVYLLTATYAGDSSDLGSTSNLVTQTVQPAQGATSTTLVTTPNPSTAGSNVTLTATVSPSTATGTITFSQGLTTLGTAALKSGSASLVVPFPTVGVYLLTATYSGDSSDLGSTSNLVTQTVQPAQGATSTTLVTTPNPSTAGSNVTLTATVSPSTATGTITFSQGLTTLGTASLKSGSASLVVPFPTAGVYLLTATYSGDSSDLGSTSNLVTQTVQPAQSATSTTLTTTPNPSTTGATVNLTATVSPASATGTITFSQGPLILGISPVNNGAASLAVPFLIPGSYSLTATYSGDSTDLGSTSNPVTQVVKLPISQSSITTVASANPSVLGKPVTFTASVSPTTATGTVTFYDGAAVLDTRPLVNGQATITTSTLPSGVQSVRAYYSGDLTDASSTYNSSQTVNTVTTSGFHTGVAYGSLDAPSSAAIGDLNGDGKADIVVANTGGGYAAVLLGNGDGTFAAAQPTASGTSPASVAIGDFNGDGMPDLAIATASSSIAVALGNGDGTFQTPANYLIVGSPSTIAVGDFNGDGIADLVAATPSTGSVSVLLGNGDGTFGLPLPSIAGPTPYNIAIGDFNGDGVTDLAVASRYDGHVYVLLGTGAGVFLPPSSISVAGIPQSIVAADFNNDGQLDLATANASGESVSVLLGNGDGTFQSEVDYSLGSGTGAGLALGDFNGDGKPDLAIADQTKNTVDIVFGKGDGTFSIGSTFAAGSGPVYVAAGEFNGDGRTDLIAVDPTGNSLNVLLGRAPQVPTTTTLVSSANPSTYGESITLTASVSPSTAGGTITFYNGSTSIGTASLAGGAAMLTFSTLPVGTHSLKAKYGGDVNDLSSVSAALSQTVSKDVSTITLSPSVNPATYGQPLTLTANVTPATATGKVVFKSGSTNIGSGTLSGGVATMSTSTLAPGSHALTAVYNGDTDDASSTSAAVNETVNRAPTTTTVVSSANPSTYGNNVTFTATVTPSVATGTITFKNGSTSLGTATLSGGTATLSASTLTPGSHSIAASYSGAADYAASSSSALTQKVTKVAATVTLASSLNPSAVGQSVTLTATVTPSTATGTITFKDGSKAIGQVTLSGGSASFATSTLPSGANSIVANYSGDTDDAEAASAVLTQTVN